MRHFPGRVAVVTGPLPASGWPAPGLSPDSTAAGMSADEVAARLLHGLKTDAFDIPTHAATRELLEARHRNLMAGYDAAARFDQS